MRRATEGLLDALDNAVHERTGDWSLDLSFGHEYAWSATVRVTQFPNVRGAPDRSTAFYQAGGDIAETALDIALRAAIADVESWDPTDLRPPTRGVI